MLLLLALVRLKNSCVLNSNNAKNVYYNINGNNRDRCTLQTMQIFYPYSMQLYPHQFPGADPHDCPKNMSKEK